MKATKTTAPAPKPAPDAEVVSGSVEQFEAAATAILAEVAEDRITAAQMVIIQEELPVVMEHRKLAREGMSRMLHRIAEVSEKGVPAEAPPPPAKPAQAAASAKAPAQKPPAKAAKPEPADGQPATGGKKKKKKVDIKGNTATAKNADGEMISITLNADQKERYKHLTRRDLIVALATDFGTDGEFETAQAWCFFALLGKGKPPSQLTMMKDAGEVINVGRSKWKLAEGVEMKGGKDEE